MDGQNAPRSNLLPWKPSPSLARSTWKIPQSSVKRCSPTDAETDGWGAEDVSKDAVDGFFPVLVDPIEQRSKCSRSRGLVEQPLSLDPGRLCLLSVDNVVVL